MSLRAIGTRHPATATPGATVSQIARQLEDRNVGSILVVRDGKPVGILTDRDLVLRIMRKGLDPGGVRAEEIMSRPVVVAPDEMLPIEAAARMRENRIRRLPIVDGEGRLVGILTLDDLVHHIGRTSGELSEAVATFPQPYEGG